jgi:hypothetical protein
LHRQENSTPVALELTMTVPMSLDDVTAALWILLGFWPREELDDALNDADFLRQQVLETVLAAGASELENARMSFGKQAPGTPAFSALASIRARVSELYGPATTPRPRSCQTAPRRENSPTPDQPRPGGSTPPTHHRVAMNAPTGPGLPTTQPRSSRPSIAARSALRSTPADEP